MPKTRTEPGRRFEIRDQFQLPDLSAVVAEGGRWETADSQLAYTYFDTSSAHLAQAGVTLVQREGEHRPRWSVHLPEEAGSREISSFSDSSTPPPGLSALVAGVRAGEDLAPIVQVKVARTTHRLLTEDGSVLAELADDRVDAATLGDESRLSSWRELEVDLKPGADARLLKRIAQRLRGAGAGRPRGGSTFQRALGRPTRRAGSTDKSQTIGALVASYVAVQCQEMVRCDIALRLDEPEVHKFRVAIRRLRSTTKVFAPVFDPDESAMLEGELVWFAGLLGEVRDRDVLLERLVRHVRELPVELVLGDVAAHLQTSLLTERAGHQARVAEVMNSDRYRLLMKAVLRWQTQPPLTKRATRPATVASRYVRRAEQKVNGRLTNANGDVEALHGARKAAKRYRYAAELTAQANGKRASRIVKDQTELQTLLGEHQDSVISADFLRRIGAQAGAGGDQNGFTYGILLADERRRAQRIREDAARRWSKKHR